MAKIDPLTTITSGFNSTVQLNSNFTKITTALNNTLSRDGSTPNNMDAILDMNSNRIINLAAPVDNSDAVTKTFLESFTSGDVDIAAAAASAAAALVSETNAATSATDAALVENSQITFTFDTSTAMADPGAGNFRYNNATVSSVTAIAFDATMSQTGDPDVSDYIATWDDSTNTVTGHVTLSKRGNNEVFAIFNVTAVTDNTGWLQVTVAHVSSSGTFSASDTIDIMFSRAGDLGGTFSAADITGQASGTVALTDNFVYENGAGGLEQDTIQGIIDLVASGSGGTLIDVQTFTTSGTWTKPADTTSVQVIVVGGGGGGGGVGTTTGPAGATAGTSSFGAHASATGGVGGSGGNSGSTEGIAGGAGGIGSGGDTSIGGGGGQSISSTSGSHGGAGGSSTLGGGGAGVGVAGNGIAGGNHGGGGGGSVSNTAGGSANGGAGGGGAGGTALEHITSGLGATETITVGPGGAGGIGTGTGAQTGGAGGIGIVIVKSYT